MTDADLDRSYSALAAALTEAGEGGAPLLLSMVCLALMSRAEDADAVLPLIEQARRQFGESGRGSA